MSAECSAGNIPPGYKQTEVGVIPEDWEVKTMNELFTFQNGVNADKSSYGSGTPFINVLEVITHSTITETRIPGKISLSAQAISAFTVQRGDILFNRTSETQEEVGLTSVYIGNEVVVFGGFVIRARPKDNSLDSIFTSYVLRSPAIRSQIMARGQGAVRANIGQQDLSRILVVLPSKPEQEAIAEALSDTDAFIESLEQLIAKKRQIKQGAMQELLTGKRRLLGFETRRGYKQTEVGAIPEDWNTVTLSKVCTLHNGRAYALHEWETTGVPVIRLQNLTGGNEYYYSTLQLPEKKYCYRGDLLYMWSATFGPYIWMGDKAIYHYHIWKVVPQDEQSTRQYLYYKLMDITEEKKMRASNGGTMLHVTKESMESTLIALPPLPEQIAIATILSDMDSEITSLEEKLAKARQIKQGMMQELLTGRIRLI